MFIDYYRADPADIAKEITCQLKAGLLVYKARRGEITHEKVKLEIENHPSLSVTVCEPGATTFAGLRCCMAR